MPYKVAKSPDCPANKPWGLIKISTGDKVSCHASKADAIAAMEVIMALEAAPTAAPTGYATATAPQSGVGEFVTIPNVPIIEVGTWYPSDDVGDSAGAVTWTEADLLDAIAAMDDPGFQSPRIKLGHFDPRFTEAGFGGDGTPAVGKAINFKLSEDRQTVLADFAGVPKWLADIMPTAYPNRSVEAWHGATSAATGRKYSVVIGAVALLGTAMPAMATLDDLPLLFSTEGPELIPMKTAASLHHHQMASASATQVSNINVEDIRRAYYEKLGPGQQWWWIRSIYLNPDYLVVDDDAGKVYRVPFTAADDGTIDFGDAAEVEVVYVEKGSGATAASQPSGLGQVYAAGNRSQSRPAPQDDQEGNMDATAFYESLGLGSDATDEEVAAEVARLKALDTGDGTDSEDGGGSATLEIPDGMSVIDNATLDELKATAARGAEAMTRLERDDNVNYIGKAIAAGKFVPAQREHYGKLLSDAPESTRALIDAMPEGTVPTGGRELGGTPSPEQTAASADLYPTSWLSASERSRAMGAVTANSEDG